MGSKLKRDETVWLCAGVLAQTLAAWGIAAGRPGWFGPLRTLSDLVSYALTAAVLLIAITRWRCPVNRTLFLALWGMLAMNLVGRIMGRHGGLPLQAWLRNIAFFGPAIYMLVIFSGMRLDGLPLFTSRFFSRDCGIRMTAQEGQGWTRSLLS